MEEYRTPQERANDLLAECKKELAREQELSRAYANVFHSYATVFNGVLYVNTLLEEKIMKAGRQ